MDLDDRLRRALRREPGPPDLVDRVLGHVDPGAMSIHYILAGMREGCSDG